MLLSGLKLDLPVDGAEGAAYIGGQRTENGLMVPEGQTVDFVTYFNAFDAGFFAENTTVSEVTLRLSYTGRASVVVIRYIPKKSKAKKGALPYSYERVGGAVSENGCEITVSTDRKGILGFLFKAEGTALITGGGWFCDDSCAKNKVRAGFVFCTYKREKAVISNASTVAKAVGINADVYVVDNGGTLTKDQLPSGVKLIPNKNLGGSGGFSRGMAECIACGNSHCILMDDDISLCGQTALDIIKLLEVVRPESANISIGAAMLGLSRPTEIYECGAYVGKAKLQLPKNGIDITQKGGLLWSVAPAKVNYSGWWFYCVPTSVAVNCGLSMPYFIKYDDAEFGQRVQDVSPLKFPLGIGVWHAEFEDKLPPYMYYYLRRNALITLAVSGKRMMAKALLKLWGSVIKFIGKQGKTLDYVFDGFDDYLKGPYFLASAGEELNFRVKRAPTQERTPLMAIIKATKLTVKMLIYGFGVRKAFGQEHANLCSYRAWKKRLDF